MSSNEILEDGIALSNLNDLTLMIHLKLADKTKDYCYTRHWFLAHILGFLEDYKGLLGNNVDRLSDSLLQKDIDRLIGKLKTTQELYQMTKAELKELKEKKARGILLDLKQQKEAHKQQVAKLVDKIESLEFQIKEIKKS